MDSKLVVEQMSGRWKIKHEDMRRLAARGARPRGRHRAGGGSVRYTWIPREENAAADALANAAMDGKTICAALDATRRRDDGDAGRLPPSGPRLRAPARPTRSGLPTSADPPGWSWCATGSPTSPSRKLDGRGGRTRPQRPGRQQVAGCRPRRRRSSRRPPGAGGPPRPGPGVRPGAVAAAIGVEPETDADWDEQEFGDWDGTSVCRPGRATTRPSWPGCARTTPTPGSVRESHRDMAKRRARGVRACRQQRPAGGRGDAPQTDHGGARPRARHPRTTASGAWPPRRRPSPVELWSDGGALVPFVNDTSHLR